MGTALCLDTLEHCADPLTACREMVKLDYQYVANWSAWNDIRIILLTVPRVIRRGGV